MLTINNLSLKTRQPILNNFSYQFNQQSVYLIVAVNGSGKTTFFRSITNLIKRENGIITYEGQSFIRKKRRIFFYETSDWFDDNLSGLDYLKFVKSQWHSTHSLENEIKFWHMNDYIKLPIRKYSLGMKQRLLIALYFCSDATYLIMDEISNGLDEDSRNLLYSRIKQAAKHDHKCIILSSHYKSDIAPIADHTLELANKEMREI